MTDQQRIEHILEGIWQIEEFVENKDNIDFLTDAKLKYACYGCLVMVSEAATKISRGTRSKLGNVEWEIITKFRNIIIHEYFRIDWDVVWDVIKINIPIMKKELENYNH